MDLIIHENLEQSERLWRYMDLAKFISMAHSKSLWLARADTFQDAHEGRFPSEMRSYIEKAYDDFDDDDHSPVQDADDFQDYLLRNTFISCWHKNLDENMVMWRLYGGDTSAVAIQTTVAKIKQGLSLPNVRAHSFLIKEVSYANAEEIPGVLLYEDCFFFKRRHFAHEMEVRISLDTYSRVRPRKDTPIGMAASINLDVLIEKILVHPDSPDWFLDAVKSVAATYKINAVVEKGRYGNL